MSTDKVPFQGEAQLEQWIHCFQITSSGDSYEYTMLQSGAVEDGTVVISMNRCCITVILISCGKLHLRLISKVICELCVSFQAFKI